MRLLSIAASLLLTTTTTTLFPTLVSASNVVDLTPDNFDDVVVKSGKPAFVEFFAPWCGHCKDLAPTWEKLADTMKQSGKSAITIAKVDVDKHGSLGKRFGIQGFPTLKWFKGNADTAEEYNSGRDLNSLLAFIGEKAIVKSLKKKEAPSSVVVLTDNNFSDVVGGSKHVFVKFYAPWCGHCKSMAPTWEKVAQDFEREPNIVVAKMDADQPNAKSTASKYDISGFPTLKFFPKGSTTPLPYEGLRTELDLVNFINTHANTHRTPGGTLDSTAGLIPSLDAVVDKFTGDAKELPALAGELKKEVEKLAEELKDDGRYYVRVAEKMVKTPDFAQREVVRVHGMIEKGGVKAEMMDGLVKRENVLTKFVRDNEGIKDEL